MEIREYYSSKYQEYQRATEKIEELITNLLTEKRLPVHGVYGRTKSIDSYVTKAESYIDPVKQITDYIGIRIITYVHDELDRVCELIRSEFDIDIKNSTNKSEELGINKIGYLSIHYIAKMKRGRTRLNEYKFLSDMCFEIQIRTLLQHTWAEIEHDRNYKFYGVLPSEIKRKFFLLSAVLEVVDSEFNAISHDIDKYKIEVNKELAKENLDIELNGSSLVSYIKRNYSYLYNEEHTQRVWLGSERKVIQELKDYGVTTIKLLSELISRVGVEKIAKKDATLVGVLRDFMILDDVDRYFKRCWQEHWTGIDHSTIEHYKKNGIEIEKYTKANNIVIHEESRKKQTKGKPSIPPKRKE